MRKQGKGTGHPLPESDGNVPSALQLPLPLPLPLLLIWAWANSCARKKWKGPAPAFWPPSRTSIESVEAFEGTTEEGYTLGSYWNSWEQGLQGTRPQASLHQPGARERSTGEAAPWPWHPTHLPAAVFHHWLAASGADDALPVKWLAAAAS
ncbi:hypothetical protein CPLU01_07479 [Colletotrichum plurivorum]|uniref:Uncharacterized protein n=1 Tax=Colletotrichum plurivorum TaxID=2175906 RepID=A0A8H6KF48_9PEZI|nr:hypothetical protein CPLU01_07479 [Colletotrichum plurivorum]